MPTSSPSHHLRAPTDSDLIDVAGDMTRLRDDVERELDNIDFSPINLKLQALESALNDLAAHVAKHDPQVLRWAGSTTVNIPGTTTWTNMSGYSWSWTVPMNGVMLFSGMAELNDQGGKTGDPRARIDLSGSAYQSGGSGHTIGGVAAASAVTIGAAMEAVARVRPGTITVRIQANMTTTNAGVGRLKRASVSALFVPIMGSFPSFQLPGDDVTDNGGDGS